VDRLGLGGFGLLSPFMVVGIWNLFAFLLACHFVCGLHLLFQIEIAKS